MYVRSNGFLWFYPQVHYLIKWVGYTDQTWEPEENCFNCLQLIAEFNENESRQCQQPTLGERVLSNIYGKMRYWLNHMKFIELFFVYFKFIGLIFILFFELWLGITDTGGRGLLFLAKFQDKDENELVEWSDMKEHFPQQTIDFFKSRIHWMGEDAGIEDSDDE